MNAGELFKECDDSIKIKNELVAEFAGDVGRFRADGVVDDLCDSGKVYLLVAVKKRVDGVDNFLDGFEYVFNDSGNTLGVDEVNHAGKSVENPVNGIGDDILNELGYNLDDIVCKHLIIILKLCVFTLADNRLIRGNADIVD